MIVTIVSSCNNDDSSEAPQDNFVINIEGLADLGATAQYEGWVVSGGTPISTGTFTVNGDGVISNTTATIDAEDLAVATVFVITIEPIPDPNPTTPSGTVMVGGNFDSNVAQISIGHPAAIGTGFAGVTGGYTLATPTTSDPDDGLSGVWFAEITAGGLQPGLTNLPDLSGLAGWQYEGWAVINGSLVSTSTFNQATGADDANPFSGTENAGLPFPGEDFINNAPAGLTFPTDLSGGMVVVTVEPIPDNSPAAFSLVPLAGPVPADATPLTFYSLNNIAQSTYPTGWAMRK